MFQIFRKNKDRVSNVTIIDDFTITEKGSAFPDFRYGTEMLILDDYNRISFEWNWPSRIRIDHILTTDRDSFDRMINMLVLLAQSKGYEQLYFADTLPEELLSMFLGYGFCENKYISDSNHYLKFNVENPKSTKDKEPDYEAH